MIKNKKATAAIIALVALIAIVSGTYAWVSLNNTTLSGLIGSDETPGGSTHDDFDAPNKDVYVENWGTVPIFARIKLKEYMETGNLAGTSSPDKKAKSLVEGASFEDKESWSTLVFASSANPFREYWNLAYGGQKYYLPVDEKNRVEGYVAQDTAVYTGTEPGVKKTRDSVVIDMTTWNMLGRPEGDYWVGDTDGWFYWASPIQPGEATGLLLDQLNKVKSIPGGTYYYGINATTQLATAYGDPASPEDYTSFGKPENGGWTDNAKALMHIVTGNASKLDETEPDPAAPENIDDPAETEDKDDPAEPENIDDPAETENKDDPAETEDKDDIDDPAETENKGDPAETENKDDPAETENKDDPAETENKGDPAETENKGDPAETENKGDPAGTENLDGPESGENSDYPEVEITK